MTDLISATLVYDGSGEPHLPVQLHPDLDSTKELDIFATQLKGTPLEKLCEIGGRACYDSFGKGRNSADFHKHILDVGHLSVDEHAPFTVNIHACRPSDVPYLALMFINRPNVWLLQQNPYGFRVTVNLRHVLEWEAFKPQMAIDQAELRAMGMALQELAHGLAPQIVNSCGRAVRTSPWQTAQVDIGTTDAVAQLVEPNVEEQQWVSLFLTGSRGFSHEQCRHGDWTAISQRSTRFVDESESPWVMHPLEATYHASKNLQFANQAVAMDEVAVSVGLAKAKYKRLVADLEPWLIARGVDKISARKQARGAARGYLGNALYTELLFSASVTQWKRMLKQRASQFADAEIRQVYASEAMCVLGALKQSRYAPAFAGWDMAPAPDGIGHVLVIAEPAAAKA